jgi:hypothetical protein
MVNENHTRHDQIVTKIDPEEQDTSLLLLFDIHGGTFCYSLKKLSLLNLLLKSI